MTVQNNPAPHCAPTRTAARIGRTAQEAVPAVGGRARERRRPGDRQRHWRRRALLRPRRSPEHSTGAVPTVPQSLLDAATAHPNATFRVVVQGGRGTRSAAVGDAVTTVKTALPAGATKLRRKFSSIDGVSATLTGKQILRLSTWRGISAITPDTSLSSTDYENGEMWQQTSTLEQLAEPSAGPVPQAPGIAIVDSGIDATKTADFGSRIVASVNLSSADPGATGDQQGHGTMVAGVAAGASPLYPGAAPNAPLVDVRTADANGYSLSSDVIAGIDWILAHQAQYDIRVVNLSMAGNTQTSFQSDPLDKAVEKLWFSGIVVVAAAGNNGTGTGAVDMSSAPGNDPFVITVGAIDQAQTLGNRRRHRRTVVVVRLHGGRLRQAGARGPRALPRDAGPEWRPPSPRRCPTASSLPATCGCRAPPSRRRSSPARPHSSSPVTRIGRPTRSRAR